MTVTEVSSWTASSFWWEIRRKPHKGCQSARRAESRLWPPFICERRTKLLRGRMTDPRSQPNLEAEPRPLPPPCPEASSPHRAAWECAGFFMRQGRVSIRLWWLLYCGKGFNYVLQFSSQAVNNLNLSAGSESGAQWQRVCPQHQNKN